jgi:hypothetical protein
VVTVGNNLDTSINAFVCSAGVDFRKRRSGFGLGVTNGMALIPLATGLGAYAAAVRRKKSSRLML